MEGCKEHAVESEAAEAIAQRMVEREEERAVSEDGESPEREICVGVEAPSELGFENGFEVAEVVVYELYDAVEIKGRQSDPFRRTASVRRWGDSRGERDIVTDHFTEGGIECSLVDDVP